MYRSMILLVLLSLAFATRADTFWLLGSFDDRDSAMAEAKRIGAEAGLATLLQHTGNKHRVLVKVMPDAGDRDGIRDQLAQLGIGDVYVLNYSERIPAMETVIFDVLEAGSVTDDEIVTLEAELDRERDLEELSGDLTEQELAEIDAMLAGYDEGSESQEVSINLVNYIVAGSFQSDIKAASLAESLNFSIQNETLQDETLQNERLKVKVESADISGTTYHRVLVGPVTEDREADLKSSLLNLGFDSALVLRGVKGPAIPTQKTQSLEIMTPPQRGYKLPGKGQAGRPSNPGDDSDYNFARLKKKLTSTQ